MTFLELCKRARQEARITGTGPAQVTNQSGVLAEVVSAVANAWLDIQALHENWLFMQCVSESELVENVSLYQVGDFGANDLARIKHILIDGNPLKKEDWDSILRSRQLNYIKQQGRVQSFCETPEGIEFFPTPLQNTRIIIQYYRQPELLIKNTDRPRISSYHAHAIIWKAVRDLAANESDSVIYEKASEKLDDHIARMQADYLPEIRLGGYL